MKMHSYMAVNGYLQGVHVKAAKTERLLRERANDVGGWDQAISDAKSRREELDQLDSTPSETPAILKNGSYFGDALAATALRNRLQNLSVPTSIRRNNSDISNDTRSGSPQQAVTPPTLPTTHALVDHPDKNVSSVAHDLSEMEADLTSSGKAKVRWPENITLWNYIDYHLLPTLVYELEYPRTDQ